ncbi:MAG: FG-GAP repeat domain-containing protein [Phycisphaerae bacterium]
MLVARFGSHARRFLFVTVLLAWPSLADAAPFHFDARRALAIGHRPGAVELADLNADGKLDLVVVNTGEFAADQWHGSSAAVFLNPGGGDYQDSMTYVVPNAPSDVAICDVSGDGAPDLILASAAPNNLFVLVNVGDGTYVPGATIPVGTDPVRVVCADFDGDKDLDLASADQFGFGWSYALNNGSGTFAPSIFTGIGDLINNILAGDVDGDGDQDIIAIGNQEPYLFKNNGFAVFTAQPSLGVGPISARAELCLLDSDAHLDLVTGSKVWPGVGDGTFEVTPLTTGLTDDWVRCFDFNGDSATDVVTGAGVALSLGGGVFDTPIDFDPPPASGPIACADFMGDTPADLVRLQGGIAGPTGFAALIRGLGNGAVQGFPRVGGGDSVWAMASGFVDSDAFLDLVVANVGTPFPIFLDGSILLLTGSGDGSLTPSAPEPAGNRVRAVSVADLNGDLSPDAVVTNFDDAQVRVFLNDGFGAYASGVPYPAGSNPEAIAVADYDNSGSPDLAIVNFLLGTAMGTVSVLGGNGSGAFAAPQTITLDGERCTTIVAAHLNNDNAVDLAISCGGRFFAGEFFNFGLYVLINNGDGTFASNVAYATGLLPRAVDACDLDGDGDQDLVVSASDPSTPGLLNGAILTFLNDGSGAFAPPISTDASNDHFSMVCKDLSGDGVPDVALPYMSSSAVSLFPGQGDGTFGLATHYATAAQPRAIVVGDLNGDGRNDLAIAHSDANEVGTMLAVAQDNPIPTASGWGATAMALMLLIGATWVFRDRAARPVRP